MSATAGGFVEEEMEVAGVEGVAEAIDDASLVFFSTAATGFENVGVK